MNPGGNPASRARYQALTRAGERYEEELATGALRGEAFAAALRELRDGGSRVPEGFVTPPKAPVVVPLAVPALIEWIVRDAVAGDWQAALREVTDGRSRLSTHTQLRAQVAGVLVRMGYHVTVVAAALRRHRTSVLYLVKRFEARLAADDILRTRTERALGAARAAETERAAVAS